ncbi:MAG: hypothetical protein R2874_06995 [Desulfobacterales bacterium]
MPFAADAVCFPFSSTAGVSVAIELRRLAVRRLPKIWIKVIEPNQGWRFCPPDVGVLQSELPVTLADTRSQLQTLGQRGHQTACSSCPCTGSTHLAARKSGGQWRIFWRIFAGCSGFLATLTYPTLINRISIRVYQVIWIDLPLFLFSGGAVLLYYLVHGLRSGPKSSLRRSLVALPLLPVASIGLAPFFPCVFNGMLRKSGVCARQICVSGASSKPKEQHHKGRFRHEFFNESDFIYLC